MTAERDRKLRALLDGTVLRIVREAPQSIRFSEIDARTRGIIGDSFDRPWVSRHTRRKLDREAAG